MRKLQLGEYVVETPLLDIIKGIKEESLNGKLSDIEKKGEWIKVTCPRHSDGKESHPSCGVYIGNDPDMEYGYAHCFTCGLAEDFVKFASECMDCSYSEARSWIARRYGIRKSEAPLELEPIVLSKNKKSQQFLDESVLASFQSWHPYMEKRHISKETAKKLQIKYDPKSECLVFPVYDEFGRLVMLTRRSVVNKKFIIDKDREKPVYLLDRIKRENTKEAVLVESQINAATLYEWGIPAIATFGCNATQRQIDSINRSGISHLLICYDGDDAGKKGTERMLRRLNPGILADVIVMDKGKDVNDISFERFKQLPIIRGEDWKYES